MRNKKNINEGGFHYFKGKMLKDLDLGGKMGGKFDIPKKSDMPKVTFKKGEKVELEIQPNSYHLYGSDGKHGYIDKNKLRDIDKYVFYEGINEVNFAHSKGGQIEVGKDYIYTQGKRKRTIKIKGIDPKKGVRYYDFSTREYMNIPVSTWNNTKAGHYMTPIKESVNESLPPGYSKFLVSLQTLIGDIAPDAWGDKRQIYPGAVKRIHNSLKKRYGSDYKKFNNMLKTQKGVFGDWYLEESVNEVLEPKDYFEIRELIRQEIASVFFDLYKKKAVWTK